jgi:hypothetical protein
MEEEQEIEYIINIQQNRSMKPKFIYHKKYFSVAHVPPPRPTTRPLRPIEIRCYGFNSWIIFITVVLLLLGFFAIIFYNRFFKPE